MASRRRTRGEGSIRKRKDRKGYEGRVTLGVTLDGKPDRRSVWGDTKADVAKQMRELLSKRDAGELAPREKRTLGEASARVLRLVAHEVRPQSLVRYEYDAARLAPLADTQLDRLTREHVEAWMQQMLDHGITADSRRRSLKWLRRVLEDAAERGWVRYNAARKVRLPKVVRHRSPDAFSRDEVRGLLREARRHRMGAFVDLALDSGARLAELLGARWDRINFQTRVWHIDQQIIEPRKGAIVLGPLKTERSYRRVKLTEHTMKRLAALREMLLAEGLAACGLVFPTTTGTFYRKGNFRGRIWADIRDAAGVREFGPHACRHTCATLLLEEGVSLKLVAERLGDSEKTVIETYAHVTRTMRERMHMVIDTIMAGGAA